MTMETEKFLKEYYNAADEDSRLLSRHGRIEYLTTMRYVEAELASDRSKRVLEIGAGTGRYSLQLAREGYGVTAVELVEHNIDVFKSHLKGGENLRILQGNALDLSMLGVKDYNQTFLKWIVAISALFLLALILAGYQYFIYARKADEYNESEQRRKRFFPSAYAGNDRPSPEPSFCDRLYDL